MPIDMSTLPHPELTSSLTATVLPLHLAAQEKAVPFPPWSLQAERRRRHPERAPHRRRDDHSVPNRDVGGGGGMLSGPAIPHRAGVVSP